MIDKKFIYFFYKLTTPKIGLNNHKFQLLGLEKLFIIRKMELSYCSVLF